MNSPATSSQEKPETTTNGLEKPLKTWNFRDVQQILDGKVFSPSDPVLRINVSGIKDRLAKFRETKAESEPPLKQARTSVVQATCSLTIWDSSSPTHETVVEQTRKCEIQSRTLSTGERTASIALNEPFMVRPDTLQASPRNPTSSYGEQSFSMQIAILAANTNDMWPPVEMKVPPPKKPFIEDALGIVRFPVLVAKWHKLPQVPITEQESLLEILASQDDHRYKPKLSLKLEAVWCEPASNLEVANAELRKSITPQRDLISPASDEISKETLVKIEWRFEGLTKMIPRIEFDGYLCALCSGRKLRDPQEFHFHLIQSHDLFKFKFSLTFETDAYRRCVASGVVKVDLADGHETKTQNNLDPREMAWQRPRHAFQLEAFLKGDESWVGKGKKNHLNIDRHEQSRSASRDVSRPEVPVSAIRRPPEQVPDLVKPPRRTFKVPKAPKGVTFYRLNSKRPLVEGEEVSESDDDIDEEWLLQKHADTIDSFTDCTPEEKEFIQKYDRHMLKEDVSSNLHASEALIRFCRLNKSWLQSYDMKKEFQKKAAALKMQGCLDSRTILACSRIINEPSIAAPPLIPTEDAMEIDSPSRTVETTSQHPNPSPPSPLREFGTISGKCSACKKFIGDSRDMVMCLNLLCQEPDFHLKCKNLSSRPANWYCSSECKDSNKGSIPPGIKHSSTPKKLPVRSLTNSPDGTGIQDLRAVLGEGVADALQAANQLNEREEVMEGEPSGKTSPSMHLNSEQDALFDSDGWLEGSRHRQEMQIGRIIDGEFVYDDEEEDGEDDDEEEEEEDEEDE